MTDVKDRSSKKGGINVSPWIMSIVIISIAVIRYADVKEVGVVTRDAMELLSNNRD